MDRARRIALKHSKQLVDIANVAANKTSAEKLAEPKPIPMPKLTKAQKDAMNAQTRARLGADWETTEEEVFGVNPAAGTTVHISAGPQVGTWAHTARLMASMDDTGFDWDTWKDEMKEEGR